MYSQDDMTEMFDNVPGLTTLQRETAKARYRFLLTEYRHRSWLYAFLFYVLRITMTVGSLTVPALLSLKVEGTDGTSALYWITWAISLAVTTSNGLMTLFKLDKRFFMLHGVAERLRTETWQYLTLAGRYSGHYGDDTPTHANQYVYYCTNIEKIRMRHMDDEYISAGEGGDGKNKSVQGAVTTGAGTVTAPAAAPAPSAEASTPSQQLPPQQPPMRPAHPPSVTQVLVPTLPPPGTRIGAPFLSPTRGGEVPTPPQPMSRRQSFQGTRIPFNSRQDVRPESPPTVGNATEGNNNATPQPSVTDEKTTALPMSGGR